MAHNRGADGFISIPNTTSSNHVNGSGVSQTGFDLYRLIQTALKSIAFNINETADTDNTTGLVASPDAITDMAGGLRRRTLSINALFPKASPSWGHRGMITAASHYTAHVDAFTLDLSWLFGETTPLEDPPVSDASYEPGDCSWRGTMVGDVSATVSVPNTNIEAAASLRLKDEDTVDTTFAGTIITNGRTVNVDRKAALQRITQSFVGDGVLTAAGDNKLFDGAIGLPDICEMILQYKSGKTETIDGFLTSLSISVARGQLVTVSGTVQLTGGSVIT